MRTPGIADVMRPASSNASISGITTSVTSKSIGASRAIAIASSGVAASSTVYPALSSVSLITSRTTSWSSTTSTVSFMLPASSLDRARGIPETGCCTPPRRSHTAFLLMPRRRRRPVGADVRIAELAVGNAGRAPAKELPVGKDELVDAVIRGNRALPGDPERKTELNQTTRRTGRRRDDDEVMPPDALDAGPGDGREGARCGSRLAGRGGIEEPDAEALLARPPEERQCALARV